MSPHPQRTDTPAIAAARRSAARTGLISGVVILLLGAALNVYVLVGDLHHHRSPTLPIIGCTIAVGGLLLTIHRWRERMKRYPRPDQTPRKPS